MKIELFKNMLSSYCQYKENIERVEGEIDDLWYELSGVKAIRYDKLPSSYNEHMSEVMKLDLIEKLEEKILERNITMNSIEFIEKKLSKLSKEEKDVCTRIIADKETYESVGLDKGYTHNAMWKKVKRDLESVM